MSRRALLGVILLVLVVGGLIFLVLSSNNYYQPETKNTMEEKVFLTTEDNIRIAGLYLPATSTKGVILAHQFGMNKSSWSTLPRELNDAGWAVLAIDLRGHGESELKYANFTAVDFNKMIYDVKVAQAYLFQQGKMEVGIVGSSIGANLAIMAVGEGLAGKGVALSPGLNFKGLAPEKDAKLIKGPDKLLLISAEDDSYSSESVKMLAQIVGPSGRTLDYSNGGHGVNLLSSKPDLPAKIIDFLNK